MQQKQQKSFHEFGMLECKNIIDWESNKRCSKRFALIGKEMQKYAMDIAILPETRFPVESNGYAFYWSGKEEKENENKNKNKTKEKWKVVLLLL